MADQRSDEQNKAEPAYAQSIDRQKFPWFVPSIDKHLVPETRELLEKYSGIPPEKQSQHVHKIREHAFQIRAYPCTGLGIFLEPYISRSPVYTTVLSRLRAGDTFLDIGCHLGGDMRRLAFDGAPTENMVGLDIVSHWDVGLEMYCDGGGRFKARFVEGDLLDEGDGKVNEMLTAKMDIISVSAVLHQWGWEKQVEAAKRIVSFSRGPGTLVVGHQIGNVRGGVTMMKAIGVAVWRHDPATFERMWEEVGKATKTEWKVKARLLTWEDMGWDPKDQAFMEEGDRVIDFVVTRTA